MTQSLVPPRKSKILFDTDPGIDDAMALLLALASPEIEVVGVTTVFGNSHVEATTRNALNLLDLAGRPDIPVAPGADRPMVLPRGRTGEFVHGDDAMGNIGWTTTRSPDQKPLDIPAAQFIAETIMANPGEITLVAVGPLTNVGLALQLEPRIAQAARNVVIMGGSVATPGNVSPLAEANIHNDPHAAALVFAAGWDVTMAGLDVTMAVRMDESLFDALRRSDNRLGRFIGQIIPFYQQFHRERYGYPNGEVDTHDPSAIAYLIDPTLFRAERWSVGVPLDGPAMGATIADRRGLFWTTPKVNCLMQVDAARFLEMFKARLTA
ncbi:MAG: nucleoside hydrolase [Candidatus Roseilinea sp.]|nr:MAG: nucleoside hydrolase [Candidatus Roseilinea sp.]